MKLEEIKLNQIVKISDREGEYKVVGIMTEKFANDNFDFERNIAVYSLDNNKDVRLCFPEELSPVAASIKPTDAFKGFTTPCFIRHATRELGDKLYALGHRSGTILFWMPNTLLCASYEEYRCFDDEWGNADNLISKGFIDCGHNEGLFLALAAMNDSNDYMQWLMLDDGDLWQCKFMRAEDSKLLAFSECSYRKATAEEIIKYFKNK